jgi:hypothetical protein
MVLWSYHCSVKFVLSNHAWLNRPVSNHLNDLLHMAQIVHATMDNTIVVFLLVLLHHKSYRSTHRQDQSQFYLVVEKDNKIN